MRHKTASGKEIIVWDNLVPTNLRAAFHQYALNSKFKIGWSDSATETAARHKYFHCGLTEDEANTAGVLPFVMNSPIRSYLNGYKLFISVINLTTPNDVHFFHTHNSTEIVLLYYVNQIWQSHWYGETVFSDENSGEVEFTVRYKPGRLVLFDGSIPHAIRPQSVEGDKYRFTYAMCFLKEGVEA
jgi:hypothetical protein